MITILFKIGATALVFWIIMLMVDSFLSFCHNREPENKNVKYESPTWLVVVGLGSFLSLCTCIVLSILIGIWS